MLHREIRTTFNPSIQEVREADLCDLEASLVYSVSTAKAEIVQPCLGKKKKRQRDHSLRTPTVEVLQGKGQGRECLAVR